MRITNKIMQNNQMYNINQNKIKEDKYATQMATNKKINRASEDPIIAIRALRLRSSVSELTQYYDKNSKDAESWLKVTEDALSTVTDVLTSAIGLANKGANKELTTTDLDAIIKEMTQLSDEYYSTGNVDYGGRYVFTGYRTDTPLTFTEKTSLKYSDIKDTFNAADVEDMTHIAGLSTVDPNANKYPVLDTNGNPVLDANGNPTYRATTEADIDQYTIGRIRLSYNTLDEDDISRISLKYRENFDLSAKTSISSLYENSGKPEEVIVNCKIDGVLTTITATLPETVTAENKNLDYYNGFTLSANSDGTFQLTRDNGDKTKDVIQLSTNGAVFASYRETTVDIETDAIRSTTSGADADKIYEDIHKETGSKAWINTDTGELLLSDALKEKLSSLPSIVNADTIEVMYDKSQFVSGDIRPENLFDCSTVNPYNNADTIHYNGGTYGHSMTYDLGYAQTIDVNTQSNDVFTTDVKRTMDDLNSTLEQLKSIETTITQIKSNIETATGSTADLNTELDAAKKARDFLRDDLQKQLEAKISDLQKALDVANLAVTENGTRSRRLELIQNRLQGQLTTFKTLQSDNEDIDMAETATNLMTAQTIYNASLQATSKISQQSLMDYI